MSKSNETEPIAQAQSQSEAQPQSQAQSQATQPDQGLDGIVARKLRGKSPGFKFVVIGILSFMLLIPAFMVWGLVEERANNARQVAATISQGWGNEQIINGPYLVVPYQQIIYSDQNTADKGAEKTFQTKYAIYSAENVDFNTDLNVEERKKSIYTTPIYHLKTNIKGKFAPLNLKPILSDSGKADLSNAFLVMGIADTAGFRSEVVLKIDDSPAQNFQPGARQIKTDNVRVGPASYRGKAILSGIHAPITRETMREGFAFDINMAINGSRKISIVPSAKNTKVAMTSNWQHPGFDGRFLPEERDITEQGFSASWTVPNLARGTSEVQLSNSLPAAKSMISVNFVEPLKFYQMISRTLKYAIAFFSLVFLAVFILEMKGKANIHWIQYVFVGLAMVIFYILLLAMAEHIGFNAAYLVASLATTGLISWYVGAAMHHKGAGKSSSLVMAGILAVLYAIIFLILKEQEYALLAGSIIAFAAITITMVATRNLDWSKQAEKQTNDVNMV